MDLNWASCENLGPTRRRNAFARIGAAKTWHAAANLSGALARDTAFVLEHGADDLPLRFERWIGKAVDLADCIAGFVASTIARKKRELERSLAALLVAATRCEPKSSRRETSC